MAVSLFVAVVLTLIVGCSTQTAYRLGRWTYIVYAFEHIKEVLWINQLSHLMSGSSEVFCWMAAVEPRVWSSCAGPSVLVHWPPPELRCPSSLWSIKGTTPLFDVFYIFNILADVELLLIRMITYLCISQVLWSSFWNSCCDLCFNTTFMVSLSFLACVFLSPLVLADSLWS